MKGTSLKFVMESLDTYNPTYAIIESSLKLLKIILMIKHEASPWILWN